jgi:tRNA 2-thiouridine synthesizing protein B
MLHQIFHSPIPAAVLARVSAGDDVIFLDNAVLNLLRQRSEPLNLPKACGCFVLSDDLASRGFTADEVLPEIEIISLAEWVELTVKHPLIQTWN